MKPNDIEMIYKMSFNSASVNLERVGELIRCKDCKFYLNSSEKCSLIDTRLHFYETDKGWCGDSFCSWGEKKDE